MLYILECERLLKVFRSILEIREKLSDIWSRVTPSAMTVMVSQSNRKGQCFSVYIYDHMDSRNAPLVADR
jgi:hypothetical protein